MVRFLVSAFLVLSACGDRLPESEGPALTGPVAEEVTESSGVDAPLTADDLALLAFLNDPSTTRELLDVEVGLDARSATNLIAHRDGPDGHFPSADDDVFETIAEESILLARKSLSTTQALSTGIVRTSFDSKSHFFFLFIVLKFSKVPVNRSTRCDYKLWKVRKLRVEGA